MKTLVRISEKLGEFNDRLEYTQSSISQTDKLEETVTGTDVVISTVGPTTRKSGNPEI